MFTISSVSGFFEGEFPLIICSLHGSMMAMLALNITLNDYVFCTYHILLSL